MSTNCSERGYVWLDPDIKLAIVTETPRYGAILVVTIQKIFSCFIKHVFYLECEWSGTSKTTTCDRICLNLRFFCNENKTLEKKHLKVVHDCSDNLKTSLTTVISSHECPEYGTQRYCAKNVQVFSKKRNIAIFV